MKVLKVEDYQAKSDEVSFPFFAVPVRSEGNCIVMFIDNVRGIAITHNNPDYVGKISEWVPLDRETFGGYNYWRPYHGQITIEV